ncbi:transcription factor TGA1-like isoform X2 [Cucumis sativus]|uniref:transcription factor TGA1 isoform X2 n=1 Tax=Cucumis sativus TaxID=3659 RepID=UPI0005EC2FAC|nr:transcription factor TGA1 isoform X2 [Cucumis sativus]XP_031739547.1 transcription factor TGA1-like isoform X2 [Cucumis sativus]
MNSSSTKFYNPGRMGLYEPIHHIGMWGETFRANANLDPPSSFIIEADPKLENQSDDASLGSLGDPHVYDQDDTKRIDKIQRRLAQNREAARKSRLRKKAYIKQLETSRIKLIQLEQELEKGLLAGSRFDNNQLGLSGTTNSGIFAFESEYEQWVEEQNRQICDLRTAVHADITDIELRILVENAMRHYFKFFRMKAKAAKADVSYIMSGMWKTSAERLFLWIGGFRPSELLKVLIPQLETLTEQQISETGSLRKSCLQAEDALRQGMEKLQQNLFESVVAGQLGEGSYPLQMTAAMERLEALVSFVNQADHLRQETLQQMYKILTTRQSAQGLLTLGEFFQRLRALSSLWGNRPCEPA